jgi:hypothetical protein
MTFMEILDGIVSFILGTVQLFIMVGFVLPGMIIYWMIHHPALTKVYAVNALPLLLFTGNGSRAILAIIVLFAMLAFKKTHNFAKYTFHTLMVLGAIVWIVRAFQLA